MFQKDETSHYHRRHLRYRKGSCPTPPVRRMADRHSRKTPVSSRRFPANRTRTDKNSVTGRHSGRQCRKAGCAYPSIGRYGFIFAQFRHRFPEYGIEYGNRVEYRTYQCRRFHTNGGYRFFLFQEQWRRTSCGHQFDCRNQRSGSCPCLFCNEALSEYIHRCS